MNSIFYKSSALLLLLVIGHVIVAQNLPSEEVEVIKSFDARLANAERLDVNPQLPAFDTTVLDYNFSVQERTIPHTYSPPALRALGVPRPPDEDHYNAFLRGGYGWPSSPLVDAHYTYNNEDNFSFLLDAQHYSVDNSSNLEHQFMMENDVRAETKFIATDALGINAYVDYALDRYDLYGYDHEVDSLSDFEAERRYNTFEIGLGLENPAPNAAAIDYEAGIFYRNHKDNRASGENTTGFTGQASKWFNEKNPLTLKFGGTLTTFNDTLDKKLNNFFAIPTFSFYKENWSAKIGAHWANSGSEHYFYPEIELQARLMDSRLIGFIGSDGGLQAHTFYHLSQFNPYVNSKIDSLLNTSQLNIYGGVKGKVDKLQYQASINYSFLENLRMFIASPEKLPFFDPVYDNGSTLGLDLSASYQAMPNLELSGIISYKIYSLDSFENAWHLPNLVIDSRVSYNTLNKDLTVWTGIRYQNGVPVPGENGETDRLNGLFDVSLGADYYFSNHFGVFVHGYNLTNNTNQRWVGYPVIGTNVLGGLLVRF